MARPVMKLGVAALGLAACAPAVGPSVDRVEPSQAAHGATVTVYGEDFCGDGRAAGDGTCTTLPPGGVTFGLELPAARAEVVSWDDGTIRVTVPDAAPAGATDIVVTVDGRSSNAADFTVLP